MTKKHAWYITIKGNDVFNTSSRVEAETFNKALAKAQELLASFSKCTIEALEIVRIERCL